MPFPIVPAITATAAAVGALRKKKKVKVNKINEKYMGMRPGGELSFQDIEQAGRIRAGGTRSAARSAQLARTSMRRQVIARGLGGASAAALDEGAGMIEAAGRERAFEDAAGYESARRIDNQNFERQKIMTAWGAELGDAARTAAREDARQSEFWNSVLEAGPLLESSIGAFSSRVPSNMLNAAAMAPLETVQPRMRRPSYQPYVIGR